MAGMRAAGFYDMAHNFEQGAVGAYRGMTPNQKQEFTPPGKTAGGAIGAGAGMATAGYMMAQGTSVGGPYGAVIGAGVGILSYLLS